MGTNARRFVRSVAVLGIAAAATSACSESPAGPGPALSLSGQPTASVILSSTDLLNDPTVWKKTAWACKNGPNSLFTWTVNGGAPQGGEINDGTCKIVYFYTGAQTVEDVVVTENPAAGTYLDSIVRYQTEGTTLTRVGVVTGTTTASGTISSTGGLILVFYNGTTPPPPPPPPGGGEGCTPGYWKQSQHFDSWPSQYSPNQQFSSVFENAFPGKTLLQVLGQGGGGLNALGRHTVAALLNGGNSAVSADMNSAAVISAFNSAYPGADYESLKNVFANFNEQGCPLN